MILDILVTILFLIIPVRVIAVVPEIPNPIISEKGAILRVGTPDASFSTETTKTPPEANLPLNPGQVRDYIRSEARKKGVNPNLAEFIVKKESNFECFRTGDNDRSFGCWQIFLPAHPNITKASATDIYFSTEWSLDQILQGNENIWSTVTHCREWYEDCYFN